MSTLQLDPNGLPLGHEAAKDAAARELAELVNELPGGIYHLNAIDAEWVMSNVLGRYLVTLKQAQTPSVTAAAIQGHLLAFVHGERP